MCQQITIQMIVESTLIQCQLMVETSMLKKCRIPLHFLYNLNARFQHRINIKADSLSTLFQGYFAIWDACLVKYLHFSMSCTRMFYLRAGDPIGKLTRTYVNFRRLSAASDRRNRRKLTYVRVSNPIGSPARR